MTNCRYCEQETEWRELKEKKKWVLMNADGTLHNAYCNQSPYGKTLRKRIKKWNRGNKRFAKEYTLVPNTIAWKEK